MKTDVGDETIEDDETAGVKQSYDQDTAPSSPTREVSEQDTDTLVANTRR